MSKVQSKPRTMNGASQQALHRSWQELRTKSVKKYQASLQAKRSNKTNQKTKSTPKEKEDTLTKKLQPIYRILRNDWLPHNRMCLAKLEGCREYATEIHHMATRRGWWLIVMKFWLPICRGCHRKITKNSRDAINSGLSVAITPEVKLDFNKHTKEVLQRFNMEAPE